MVRVETEREVGEVRRELEDVAEAVDGFEARLGHEVGGRVDG